MRSAPARIQVAAAPGTDNVEVLEREAERVDDAVAAIAGLRRAMQFHPGAQRFRLLAGLGRQVDIDARRR